MLYLEEKAVAAEYHNNVQLNSPETIRPQEAFLFGYAQLRNNWRGVLPADNGKQQIRRELVSLPYLFYYNYNCPIGFLHLNFG
ncbi:hypothetical protein M5585_12810 [Serratia ureilytica]